MRTSINHHQHDVASWPSVLAISAHNYEYNYSIIHFPTLKYVYWSCIYILSITVSVEGCGGSSGVACRLFQYKFLVDGDMYLRQCISLWSVDTSCTDISFEYFLCLWMEFVLRVATHRHFPSFIINIVNRSMLEQRKTGTNLCIIVQWNIALAHQTLHRTALLFLHMIYCASEVPKLNRNLLTSHNLH
jgi:hypothetical protein